MGELIKTLAEQLANLNLKQASELAAYMKQEYGIEPATSAAVVVPSGPAPASAAPAEEEKTMFNVILKSIDSAKKIEVIKTLRSLINTLQLKEAKDLVESAPQTIKEQVSKREANELKTKLESAGAVIELQ